MQYVTDRELGKGSFGTVYEAHDSAGNRYAVKIVESGDVLRTELLRKEFDFLSSLDHKRIVKVVDFDAEGPRGPMMVSEMVDGVDLGTYIRTHGTEQLALVTARVLDGLRYLHGLGRVHGDIKPDSILIYESNGEPEVKLIDAGLDVEKGARLPTLAGTPSYMAPEIIRNLKADGRSDLYSLGVTLYEILTGETPFAAASQEEAFRKHLEYHPPPPSKANPECDRAWDAFTAKLMAKEALMRYGDADQAGLDLEKTTGRPGLYLGNLTPPGSIPLVARQDETDRAARDLMPPGGKGVIIHGEGGTGISSILERIGTLAKIGGREVFEVILNKEMPAMAQVVERVLGPQAGAGNAVPSPRGTVAADDSACFREVLDSFRACLKPEREHLLIVDGGEVMEPHELVLLGALAEDMNGRLGILVGYQAGEHLEAKPPGSDGFTAIEIHPLCLEEVEKAIAWHFGTHALPPELAEEVYHGTRGKPGLVQLALNHMWNSGSLSFCEVRGALQLEWNGQVEVPASAEDIVGVKLAGLGRSALEVLKVVFLGGGRIEAAILSEWLRPADVHASVQELADAGLVERREGSIRLRIGKDFIAEALGTKMSEGEKEEISLRAARILEGKAEGAYDYYRLGLLYLQAGRHQEAFRCLDDAGDRFARFSIRDALLAYRKALDCRVEAELLASVSEKTGELKLEQGDLESAEAYFDRAARARPTSLRKLGWVKGLRGEFEESVGILKRCEESANENKDRIETARVQSNLGYIYAMQSRNDLSLSLLEAAREVFGQDAMHLEAGQTSNRIAIVHWKAGDLTRAVGAWQTAKAYFDRAGDPKRAAVALMSLGLCLRKEMDFAGAERCFEEALGIFTDIRAVGEKASCQQNYALLLTDQGNLERAAALAQESLAVSSLLGWHSDVVACRILLGALAVEAGDWASAETRLRRLLEDETALDSFQKSMVKRYLALAASVGGRFRQAEALAGESRELADDAGDAEGCGQAVLAAGAIMLRKGSYSEALVLAREGLAALRSSSSMLLAHEARRIAGEALCRCGKPGEGIAGLLEAKAGLEAVPQSLYMARVLRALALGCFLEGEHGSSKSYLRKSADICRAAGARYDYAQALLLGGKHALERGNLLRSRHCLLEAARIFNALKIDDLHEEVVNEMEKVPSGDLETTAVSSLSKISQTLNSSHDLTTVLNRAMDLAIEYLGAERGVIMLKDEATGELTNFAVRSMDPESLEEAASISRSIVESVRKTKEPVIAGDATQDPRFKHSRSVKTHNIMSVMCVPLTMADDLLGIIYLDSRDVSSGFSGLEKAFVEAFANQVSLAITNARLFGRLYDDVADLKVQADEKYSFENIIGPGKKMQEVLRKVDRAARSDLRILITGENGTGKQVIANLVHRLSDRKDEPMIQVNCAAIAKDLLEAELFGIEKHVATGVSPRSGLFERADKGTIFLDEIGDMPATTQMKVLRVLSEGEFERVGGSKIIKVDVRVISATNKDLRDLVEKGAFRRDLYYRLNHMRIHIPALRERKEDLPFLIQHFLARYSDTYQKPGLTISREAMSLLRQYWWPGNVRELETCVQHAVVKADGQEIRPEHLHDEILDNLRNRDMRGQLETDHVPLPLAIRRMEKWIIEKALKECGGVKTSAAELLGIHESTLRKKIKGLGIGPKPKS